LRADRLLSLLLILQTGGKVKAKDLARRLEVSQRTVYRDLDALTASGVPVYAEPGPAGGIALLGDYRTELTGLNDAKIQALFLTRPARLLADLGLAKASEAALIKLLAAIPVKSQRGAEDARQRLYIDVTGWKNYQEAVPFLPALQEAIWRERKLRLRYARADGQAVARLADPLGLVARGSVWYLVASVEGEVRSYRVSRVQDATVTDEPCVRQEGFDLAAYWEASKLDFKANLPRYPVTVLAAPDILERMRTSGRYARVEEVEEAEDADGWLKVHILFEVAWEACEYVLSFGPQLEVVEPPALRERVIRLAERTVTLYARP
jgi:predicted DNA-binding transcriptional regulator YafY